MGDKIKCLLLSILYVLYDFRKNTFSSETCINLGIGVFLHLDIDLLVTTEQIYLSLNAFFFYHTACRKCDSAMETLKSCLCMATRWMRPRRVKLHKTVTFKPLALRQRNVIFGKHHMTCCKHIQCNKVTSLLWKAHSHVNIHSSNGNRTLIFI